MQPMKPILVEPTEVPDLELLLGVMAPKERSRPHLLVGMMGRQPSLTARMVAAAMSVTEAARLPVSPTDKEEQEAKRRKAEEDLLASAGFADHSNTCCLINFCKDSPANMDCSDLRSTAFQRANPNQPFWRGVPKRGKKRR